MDNKVNKWIWTVSGKKKIYIPILAFVSAISGLSGVLYALLLREIVDSAIAKNVNLFKRNALFTIALVVVQLLLRAIIRWLNELAKSELENSFKERLFSKILYKKFERVGAVHSGEWMNRLTNDTKIVADGLVDIIPGLCGMISKLVGAVFMIIALDVRLAIIILPLSCFFGIMTYVFRRILKKLHKEVQEKDGFLRIFFQEYLGSLMIVRAFSKEEEVLYSGKQKMKSHKDVRMKRNYFSNFCNFGFGAAMNGMYLVGVLYCGYGILTSSITVGTLTAITQLISQIQAPFANITGYLPRYYALVASAERLMDIENFPDEGTEKVYDKEYVKNFYDKFFKAMGIRNGEFSYYPVTENLEEVSKENSLKVFENLNIEINKGEYVAFTGSSGCGKSTILKNLMTIYELDKGENYIKLSDGSEDKLDYRWRKLFAYVPQGNHLMSGTIGEAVSFENDKNKINEDKLINALKIACANGFVDELENGVDTLLGERGSGLSEGQMQRLAIARAIYSDNPVLLLDEATSALDSETEKNLLINLRNMTDKTVIIVTHREASLKICDREICIVDNSLKK